MNISDLLNPEKMKALDEKFDKSKAVNKKISRTAHRSHQERLQQDNSAELNQMESTNEKKGMQAMAKEEDYF